MSAPVLQPFADPTDLRQTCLPNAPGTIPEAKPSEAAVCVASNVVVRLDTGHCERSLLCVSVLTGSSRMPYCVGEKPDSRSVGPFTPFAEKWNGRIAMLGFTGARCCLSLSSPSFLLGFRCSGVPAHKRTPRCSGAAL